MASTLVAMASDSDPFSSQADKEVDEKTSALETDSDSGDRMCWADKVLLSQLDAHLVEVWSGVWCLFGRSSDDIVARISSLEHVQEDFELVE